MNLNKAKNRFIDFVLSVLFAVRNWIRWLLTTAVIFSVLSFSILLYRSHSSGIRQYFPERADWIYHAIIFGVCLLVTYHLYLLFTPRLRHLKYLFQNPPAWLACILGVALVCVFDLTTGLAPKNDTVSLLNWLVPSSNHSLGSVQDWLVFCGVPLLCAVVYLGLRLFPFKYAARISFSSDIISTNIPFDWPTLDSWLRIDTPAEQDFFGTYSVARRLANMLKNGTRSIGIVGPFGSGKTTLVKWIKELSKQDKSRGNRKLLFCEHSCWGFEDSATAIYTMLSDAIKRVSERLDTFHVRSLPESYRQMFSIGGKWLDNASQLIFSKSNLNEQFRQLSELLQLTNTRLVIVVEDLDRNSSTSFDIQDILAFLQRFKEYEDLSFILTGGVEGTSRIDYQKLCDHTELMKEFTAEQTSKMISLLRERCLDSEFFKHESLIPANENPWNTYNWALLQQRNDLNPPNAITRLLQTPRTLRNSLRQTYDSWLQIYGEVDWDHVFAVNTLKYGAPEAFYFLYRHWGRLKDSTSDGCRQNGQLEKISDSLNKEWDDIVDKVKWDARAGRALIYFLLPTAADWMEKTPSSDRSRIQSVQTERYWRRVVWEEIEPNSIRDQEILCDIREWIAKPSANSQLVEGVLGFKQL